MFLHEIGHVDGHLLDFSIVKLFNVAQRTLVILSDEVDGDTLAAETSTTTDSAMMMIRERKKQMRQISERLLD